VASLWTFASFGTARRKRRGARCTITTRARRFAKEDRSEIERFDVQDRTVAALRAPFAQRHRLIVSETGKCFGERDAVFQPASARAVSKAVSSARECENSAIARSFAARMASVTPSHTNVATGLASKQHAVDHEASVRSLRPGADESLRSSADLIDD